MSKNKLAVAYCVHDDARYLGPSVRSFAAAGPVFVFVSKVAWNEAPGDWEAAARAAECAGAEVVLGEWQSEPEHRLAVRERLLEQGFQYALIPDGDEVIEPELLPCLGKVASVGLAERVYVEWDTYWKSPEYVIRPRERFTPTILVDCSAANPIGGRNFEGGRGLFLSAAHGIVHHLSYSGPDERIRRKINTWGHRDEVRPGWWENVWLAWDSDKLLRNLHPTHPEAYGFAERIEVPDLLASAYEAFLAASEGKTAGSSPPPIPTNWPALSVVIPAFGGEEDTARCLDSLAACKDLLREVILVDNGSPDGTVRLAYRYNFVRLIQNPQNLGFPKACNQGLAEAKGDIVIFLNNDVIPPRAGLIRLVEALTSAGSIAAVGPFANCSGHHQQLPPTYTSLATLELFANDFAYRSQEDLDVDMLVGFCLAAKRNVLDELGPLDERFGLGTFEDNDLCYRMRRAGYRLVIAARSYVHHAGSKTLKRSITGVRKLLATNERVFREKWRDDLECGFASHLSGLSAEPIVFDQRRHPDVRRRRARELARRADISLCMIVRNEERVLAAALESAKPFFREMIVVDTGSTDMTVEIAREAGAKVFESPWMDSFADARNESLRHATGKWIFWMDADDTLPWKSGEAILKAALAAPKDVMGFVIPVQFVEEGPGSGTRVDHIKLFRNLDGLAFEGRIHEQILPSIRAKGGNLTRCEAVVLHSGYDTSERGQAKKRERDFRLLELDLKERPDHPFVLFNLGMTHHYDGSHEKAIRFLRQSLNVAPPADSHVRKAWVLLGISLRELGHPDEAMHAFLDGLDAVRHDPELHFQLAVTLSNAGRLEEAKAEYVKVLGVDVTDHFSSVDVGILGFKTLHNLGLLSMQMENYAAAKGYWLDALEEHPASTVSAIALFEAAKHVGDSATAQRTLEHVYKLQGPSEEWAQLSAGYHERLGGIEAAEAYLLNTCARFPDAPGPRLVLSRGLLNTGREHEAICHLLTLNELEVAEAAFHLGVFEIRKGSLVAALGWMERALELDPVHDETRRQVKNLRKAIDAE